MKKNTLVAIIVAIMLLICFAGCCDSDYAVVKHKMIIPADTSRGMLSVVEGGGGIAQPEMVVRPTRYRIYLYTRCYNYVQDFDSTYFTTLRVGDTLR